VRTYLPLGFRIRRRCDEDSLVSLGREIAGGASLSITERPMKRRGRRRRLVLFVGEELGE
jgi:hypothetical protein